MTADDKSAALKRERDKQRAVVAYHRAFGGEDGAAVLADLRKSFGTDFQAFLPGHEWNPIVAAIRDGQRGVVLHIEAMLRQAPEADGNRPAPKRKVKK